VCNQNKKRNLETDEETDDSTNSSKPKPWGPALLAAFIVNLCTLVGVLIFIPASLFSRKVSTPIKKNVLHIVIPSFACGALSATAIFLLIPEALHLIGEAQGGEEEHRRLEDAESQTAWKFGASVLGGYFIPFVFAGVFRHSHVPDDDDIVSDRRRADNTAVAIADETSRNAETSHNDENEKDLPKKDGEHDGEDKDEDELGSKETTETLDLRETIPVVPDYQLAASILIGDFFHNFADGVFIGTAFLLCSSTIGTTVAASTIFHELSQELADYFLLTNQCGFSPLMALTLNFISGLSVMIGVIVILATDVSDETVGVLLSMSAGVYFYIAFTECAPRISKYITDTRKRVLSFLFWVVGAVPITLVLLNHEHCE
jgi:zinc transporter ZupT